MPNCPTLLRTEQESNRSWNKVMTWSIILSPQQPFFYLPRNSFSISFCRMPIFVEFKSGTCCQESCNAGDGEFNNARFTYVISIYIFFFLKKKKNVETTNSIQSKKRYPLKIMPEWWAITPELWATTPAGKKTYITIVKQPLQIRIAGADASIRRCLLHSSHKSS